MATQRPGRHGYTVSYVHRAEAWHDRVDDTPGHTDDLLISQRALPSTVHRNQAHVWDIEIVDQTDRVGRPSILVKVFSDSVQAYSDFPEFFTDLATARPTTLIEVMNILDRLGVEDATPRVPPTPLVIRLPQPGPALRAVRVADPKGLYIWVKITDGSAWAEYTRPVVDGRTATDWAATGRYARWPQLFTLGNGTLYDATDDANQAGIVAQP